MSKQATTPETVLLPESDLIPLALVAVEIGESVDRTAHRFGEEVVLDDVGMRAVPADAARRYFTERAEWKARSDEEHRRRTEELAQKKRVVAGVPAQEGMSAYESMVAAGGVVTPDEEWGREKPRFLEDELAEGAKALAERQARAKDKLRDQMKKDLR